MKRFTRKPILLAVVFAVVLATQSSSAAPPLPNPILFITSQEYVTVSGKQVVRYHYDVFNKDAYPAEMFAAAPNLPPCGSNTNASRTWVDFYDQRGKKLNGFCALGKPSDLGKIWVAFEADAIPPSWIYIEMTDRQTNTKYKSNLAETIL